MSEYDYLELMQDIVTHGTYKQNRTGVATLSKFGAQLRFNLAEGFPLLTTKKVFTKGIFGELIWLLRGETNIKYLNDNNIHIWDEWADENGDLGPVYGAQWRRWPDSDDGYNINREIDQIENALNDIRNNPDSRRIVVTAWNPSAVPDQALPPCHMFFQFEVHSNKLSCHMYMRSADLFLGVPFNIASYAALTHVMAHLTGRDLGDLIVSFGDVHIYENHMDAVTEQLSRSGHVRAFPTLRINPRVQSIDDLEISDFEVSNYNPHPTIKAPVAV